MVILGQPAPLGLRLRVPHSGAAIGKRGVVAIYARLCQVARHKKQRQEEQWAYISLLLRSLAGGKKGLRSHNCILPELLAWWPLAWVASNQGSFWGHYLSTDGVLTRLQNNSTHCVASRKRHT